MAVTVTSSKIVNLDTEIVITQNAATSTVIDETEAFTVTPVTEGSKIVFTIEEGSGSHGAVAYSVAAGSEWGAANAYTGSVAQGTKEGFVLDTAKYKNSSGNIVITLTPASGKRLLTDHAASMEVIEVL